MKNGRPAVPAIERFWKKIQLDWKTDCWNWIGAISPAGYGIFTDDNGRNVIAHRAGYEMLLDTKIPDGYDVHHLCHNRKCVATIHLLATSRADHCQHHTDERTHCPNNHCYAEVGFTIVMSNGKPWRKCKECAKDNWRKTNEKRKLARKAKPPKPPRTHCRKGLHELVPNNIAYSNGKPTCKACWGAAKACYIAKHKAASPRGTPKLFCVHNHAMTPENTYIYKGRRSCRLCIMERIRKHRAKATSLGTTPPDSKVAEGGNGNHSNTVDGPNHDQGNIK